VFDQPNVKLASTGNPREQRCKGDALWETLIAIGSPPDGERREDSGEWVNIDGLPQLGAPVCSFPTFRRGQLVIFTGDH